MVLSAASRLAAKGHRVDVFALPLNRRPQRFSTVQKALEGVPYHECWSHTFDADVSYFVFAPLLWRLFRTASPRIAGLHGFFGGEGESLAEVSRLKMGPRLRALGPRLALAGWYSGFLGGVELSSFDAVHTVAKSVMLAHRKTMFVPNWIDRDVFKPSGEKSQKFTVLFVGRREWIKGYDLFEAARKMLSTLGRQFTFAYAGTAGREEDQGGYLVDPVSMAEAYSGSHVTVCPSRVDTFGLAIVESLACGTPAISTSIPTHKALQLPMLYADGASEIVERILRLYEMWRQRPTDYERLCRHGVVASEAYDSKRVFPRFEQMLNDVASMV